MRVDTEGSRLVYFIVLESGGHSFPILGRRAVRPLRGSCLAYSLEFEHPVQRKAAGPNSNNRESHEPLSYPQVPSSNENPTHCLVLGLQLGKELLAPRKAEADNRGKR